MAKMEPQTKAYLNMGFNCAQKLLNGLKRMTLSVLRVGLLVLVLGCLCVNKLMFHPVAGGYSADLPGYVELGSGDEKIAAVIRGPHKGKKAILYCHGNAEDLTSSLQLFQPFVRAGYTYACVDYPGYGLSAGSPDEAGCYRVVHCLYDYLITQRGFKPEEIVVVGFSIGTGPAVELAATCPVGGLVLQAAYLSAPRIVTRVRVLPIDPFPSLKRIGQIKCPLLMFHGSDDSIIPYRDGRALYDLAPEPKQFIAVKGGDHNDFIGVYGYTRYLQALFNFLAR